MPMSGRRVLSQMIPGWGLLAKLCGNHVCQVVVACWRDKEKTTRGGKNMIRIGARLCKVLDAVTRKLL